MACPRDRTAAGDFRAGFCVSHPRWLPDAAVGQPDPPGPPQSPRSEGCLIRTGGDGRLGQMGLSERERAILEFEGSWWTVPGRKEAAIRSVLGMSPSRYRQILGSLIDSAEAESAQPLLVRRLRRDRDRRRRARFEGRPVGGRKA